MIQRAVDFALNYRLFVIAFAILLVIGGYVAFHYLPIDAYPDVADNYVEIITQWPGISAEQVEQQVTIPLEIVMNGIPGVVHLRSFSLFGLSDLKLIFADNTSNFENRERVLERMSQATLPPGIVPTMGTDWSPAGQIYFFTLRNTNPAYDVMELKSLEDWVVEKNLKSVPDIVDVSSFGGPTREYQVRLDPDKLISYGLSLSQVEQQLTNNNVNAGGSFIEAGEQQIDIREVGLVQTVHDIENTVLLTKNGTPLRVKDIAVVSQGPKIRLGQFARAIHREDGSIIDNPDVVSAWVPMRKGADAEEALDGLHKKVQETNDHILPPGIKIVPFSRREGVTKSIPERIRAAAHEVQRPVFYAITIVITAYLPIFTLQRVEGRLFQPMAWTVAFALLGAVIFSMTIAPVLASIFFRKETTEWRNPVMEWITKLYGYVVTWTVRHRWVMVALSLAAVSASLYLLHGRNGEIIGSEFLPHLDEGSLWVRGTLAPSIGPTDSIQIMNRARIMLCSFPEATDCTSQTGRPDDGTDTTGFFNTEYFVGLKPKEQWRPAFHRNKEELIGAMNAELDKIPGVVWGFSQPIADNMEEAVSGIKGQLATKVYGEDLKVLEEKADQIVAVMRRIPGIEDLGVFRVLGQPNLNITVDRRQAARYQINVADVQDAIQTAVGGNALTQVLQGEARYDLVLRYLPQFRDKKEAIEKIRLLAPTGERVSLAQLCKIQEEEGASEIYREGNERYIAIKYSVRGRDLGGAVGEAIDKVAKQVEMPRGYHVKWEGEYESKQRADERLLVVLPLTVFFIGRS